MLMTEILRPIGVIFRALDSIANIEFQDIDLSRRQYLYLTRICEQPGIILEQLADLVKVDKTTVTRALQKLEKKGLIVRKNLPGDRKSKQIFPTESAQKIYPQLQREEAYSNQTALRGLSADEQSQLESLLNRVAENVDDDWHQVKKGYQRKY